MRLAGVLATVVTAGRAELSGERRRLQPSAAACCFARGAVVLSQMPICEREGTPFVHDWRGLKACWKAATAHYGNATRIDPSGTNVTVAETHPIFIVNLAAGADIAPPLEESPLVLDASTLPTGITPTDEMLPFQIVLAFPFGAQGPESCPRGCIDRLRLQLTDKKQLGSSVHPLVINFAGCNRNVSSLTNLDISAIGWGNPQFGFLSMSNASVVAIAPTSSRLNGDGSGDAVSWLEADIANSEVSYFGDVVGTFGDSFGATQNGSRALDTTFKVVDPKKFWGATYMYRAPALSSNYQFSWYGANWDGNFRHITDCHVEYISDVSLGSINVIGSTFAPWLPLGVEFKNPVLSGGNWSGDAEPPYFTVYNMGTDTAPLVDNGAYIVNSKIVGLWEMNLARSYFRDVHITMASLGNLSHNVVVPKEWNVNETRKPTWTTLLNSDLKIWPHLLNAFPTALDHCIICFRAAFVREKTLYSEQKHDIEDSATTNTRMGLCL
eukprot:SAG31_NODE_3533_length_4149_cov_5.847901_1_plen_496_part_00